MKSEHVIKLLTPIIAILAIVLLELVAISKGMNGVMLAGSVALIAGIGGFTTKTVKDKIKKTNGG